MNFKFQSIAINDLILNHENPRIDPVKNQGMAINAIMDKYLKKIKKIAKDIAIYGLNPGKRWLVVKNGTKYIVLEGNRRLTSLKLIINPNLMMQSQS